VCERERERENDPSIEYKTQESCAKLAKLAMHAKKKKIMINE
jgi:hypothetical protein